MNSLVSIIIPNYNKAPFIQETVNSVLNQTYANFEVIIVDDGSTDNSKEILKSIEHPKIKIYYKTNTGVCETRNFAISKSKGTYILPLDSDDLLEPTFLEKTVHYLNENESCIIVHTQTMKFGAESGIFNLPEFSIKNMLVNNMIVNTALFRKSTFDKTAGYSTKFNDGLEDWAFWLSMVTFGGDVHKIQEPLFKYRIQKKSRNHVIDTQKLKEIRARICKENINLYTEHFPLSITLYDELEASKNEINKYKRTLFYKVRKLLKRNKI